MLDLIAAIAHGRLTNTIATNAAFEKVVGR